MGTTTISWTGTPTADGVVPGYTFNPWIGCTKATGADGGCAHCYAERFDHRFGGGHWGVHQARKTMSEHYWNEPLRWNRKAAHDGVRRRVFSGSQCDWTDKEAPAGARERLWSVIRATPHLDWLLLTKRGPRIDRSLPWDWDPAHRDRNVWLGVSVENRKYGLPRIEHLRKVPAAVRFLSIEPLLEDLGEIDLDRIDWVIVGGESGPNARPMELAWVLSLRRQCVAAHVPFFYKQRGGARPGGDCLLDGSEVKEWPEAA